MGVVLSSLKVDATFTADGYARGAAQKTAADQAMIASDKARNAALAQADAAMKAAVPGLTSISRSLLDGYKAGQAFDQAMRGIGNAVDRGMGLDRANILLDAAYRKFGMTADAAQLAQRGYGSIAGAVAAANDRFAAGGNVIDLHSGRMINSARAAEAAAKATGLTSWEMKNLGFQLNDVGTMLAAGSSPMQVLATQSGQVYQILNGSAGGVGGAVKDLAGRVIGFLGPLGLMAVGFTAVAGAAAYLFTHLKTEAPTAEKLLGEHDRLLGVIKTSYDKVTGSAANWFTQSKDVTRLQLLQQEIDLQQKLTDSVTKALRPTVKMDILGGGVDVIEKLRPFRDAIATLNEGWQNGQPNVRAYVDEVARIGLASPTLQKLSTDLIASTGDASKFAMTLHQIRDALKFMDGGKLSGDERGRLGLPDYKPQINAYDQLIARTRDRIAELRFEGTAAGQTAGAVEALRLQHEAERAAKKAGVGINQAVLDQMKEELQLRIRQREAAQIASQIQFGRQTSLLSPDDVQIAQQLKTLYPDVATALASVEAAGMRTNNALSGIAGSLSGTLTTGLVDIADHTKSIGAGAGDMSKAFIRALNEMIVKLYVIGPLMKALQFGASSIFGGGVAQGPMPDGSVIPSARGNVFSGGNVIPFATGGIISRPTTFQMANGRTGLAGEAGAEAIVPLRRGPDGRLGVASSGGGGTSPVNNFYISGAQSRPDVNATPNGSGGQDIRITFRDAVRGVVSEDAATGGPMSKALAGHSRGFGGS